MALIDANGVEWVFMKNSASQKPEDPPVKATRAAFEEVWSKHPSPWKEVQEKTKDAGAAALAEITAHVPTPEASKPVNAPNIDASQGSNQGKVG